MIANPTYDAVFKYLLEDMEIARLIISTVLDTEIISLRPSPTESPLHADSEDESQHSIRGFRKDYAAVIINQDGKKQKVLVEMQKRDLNTTLTQFRRYIAHQFIDNANMEKHPDEHGKEQFHAIPLISIYFLNYSLKDYSQDPVIRSQNVEHGMITDTPVEETHNFVEGTTLRSFYIQLGCLQKESRTELEAMLNLFNDRNVETSENKHLMEVDIDRLPDKFKPIYRRLGKAAASEFMRNAMDKEDDIYTEMAMDKRSLKNAQQIIKRKEQTISEQKQVLFLKDKALEKKDKALEEKDLIIARQRQITLQSAKKMLNMGNSVEQVANVLNLSEQDVRQLKE